MATPSLIADADKGAWQKATKNQIAAVDRKLDVGELAAQIGDYRLDYREAIEFAIQLHERYDPETHGRTLLREEPLTFRQIARLEAPERFVWINNVSVAVKAWEILQGERE